MDHNSTYNLSPAKLLDLVIIFAFLYLKDVSGNGCHFPQSTVCFTHTQEAVSMCISRSSSGRPHEISIDALQSPATFSCTALKDALVSSEVQCRIPRSERSAVLVRAGTSCHDDRCTASLAVDLGTDVSIQTTIGIASTAAVVVPLQTSQTTSIDLELKQEV